MNKMELKGLIGTRFLSLPTKQDALLFDTIFISGEGYKQKNADAELAFLQENGIVNIIPESILNDGFLGPSKKMDTLSKKMFSNLMTTIKRKDLTENEKTRHLLPVLIEYWDRSLAVIIKEHYDIDAVPILEVPPKLKIPKATSANTLRFLISSLPLPSDEVPWESIIDFREDEESRSKLLEFRRWIRKITKEKISAIEIQEELEFLIYDYSKRLNLHKMKTRLGYLQAFITTPIGIIENVIKLNFKQAVSEIFSVQKEKINLIDGELNLPGREVAYIIHAREHFE